MCVNEKKKVKDDLRREKGAGNGDEMSTNLVRKRERE